MKGSVGRQNPQPITQMEKSARKSDCIDHRQMCVTGPVLEELKDLICCIKLTKEILCLALSRS